MFMNTPNRNIIQKILVVILASVTSNGFSGESLNWEACVKEAEQNNAPLSVARESVNRADAQLSTSYSPFLPLLTGSAGYNRNGNSGNLGISNGLGSSSNQSQYSLGLNTSINVFNGFQDSALVKQAKANLDGQRASLQLQRATLQQDLKKAFAQLLYAQSVLLLNKEIEKRRNDNFDLVEMRFKGGRENKGSFLRSKASLRQAQFDVSQSKRNLRVAQAQLARLLGRDLLEPITAVGELKTKTLEPSKLNFRELAKQTPSAIQTSYEFRAAQQGVTRAYGVFYPSVALNGSLSRTGASFPPESNQWSAGVTVSIPIFQWGNFADVGSARADERKAEINVRNAEEQAGAKLEETYANLSNSIERVEVQSETLTAATVRSEIARSQYSSGLITYNDWDIIENDLMSQQQNLLSTKRDAVNAEANWEQALGKGDLQ